MRSRGTPSHREVSVKMASDTAERAGSGMQRQISRHTRASARTARDARLATGFGGPASHASRSALAIPFMMGMSNGRRTTVALTDSASDPLVCRSPVTSHRSQGIGAIVVATTCHRPRVSSGLM